MFMLKIKLTSPNTVFILRPVVLTVRRDICGKMCQNCSLNVT